MAENSKIEWTDNTFNPWIGCTKVSPACDNCYAEALMDVRHGRAKWGAGEDRSRTAVSTWRQPRKWNRDAVAAGTRPFVFCASLADVFDNEVDERWRLDLFTLIEETPALVWLLLTKRIGNVRRMTDPMRGCRPIPGNVAIGATMANQEEYDRDRMKLAEAKHLGPLFTFGSFEPLLGPVILDNNAPDWIIVGGESGSKARPMDLDWARSLKRQSADLGRVFNFKQVGGRGADKGGHELDGVRYFDRPLVPPTGAGGLGDEVVAKTIRHTIATYLRTHRVPSDEVETLLGHRVLKKTTGVYAKYDPDYLANARGVLATLFREVMVSADLWVAGHLRAKVGNGPTVVLRRDSLEAAELLASRASEGD